MFVDFFLLFKVTGRKKRTIKEVAEPPALNSRSDNLKKRRVTQKRVRSNFLFYFMNIASTNS